jgi:hypothetical protein
METTEVVPVEGAGHANFRPSQVWQLPVPLQPWHVPHRGTLPPHWWHFPAPLQPVQGGASTPQCTQRNELVGDLF